MQVQSEPLLKIEIYSHFFKVHSFVSRVSGILLKFAHKYVHYKLVNRSGKTEREMGHTFASRTKDGREYRFHIGQLPEFLKELEFNYVELDLIEITKKDLFVPSKVKIKVRDSWKLYDYQEEAVNFILQDEEDDLHSRLLTIPTGKGKTVTALWAACLLGNRIIYEVLPKYMEKSAADAVAIANITEKEVMLIQGSDQLKGLIQMGIDKLPLPKIIIISIPTIRNFFKMFEEDRFSDEFLEYGCEPHQIYEILDTGTVIVDEAHEHIHSVFKLMVYAHVHKFIALSGTMVSDDAFIARMQHTMFPKEIRFDKIKMDKYIKLYPISYLYIDFQGSKVRTTEFGSNHYSHNAYEKFLMKKSNLLQNYIKLIDSVVDFGYISGYIPGDKLAIYASSISMCTYLTEHYKKKYPHLNVRRYVEDDPYENIIEPDIRVTTILSGGTAVDIPNLRTVIMTNSLNSTTSNLQVLGRLRNLKDRDVKFYYLYCEQIKKQVEYHRNKLEMFKDRVLSTKEFRANISL